MATPATPARSATAVPRIAHLNRPTDVAIARNGDLYIADMGHNRIRLVDAHTGFITTVAGDGTPGRRGDGGPAVAASLGEPAGLVLASEGGRSRFTSPTTSTAACA